MGKHQELREFPSTRLLRSPPHPSGIKDLIPSPGDTQPTRPHHPQLTRSETRSHRAPWPTPRSPPRPALPGSCGPHCCCCCSWWPPAGAQQVSPRASQPRTGRHWGGGARPAQPCSQSLCFPQERPRPPNCAASACRWCREFTSRTSRA